MADNNKKEQKNPFVTGEFHFVVPEKKITSKSMLQHFLQSEVFQSFMNFLSGLNESVKGKSNSTDCLISKSVRDLCDLLETLHNWIDEIPPIEQPMRFGNKAFRVWHEKLTKECKTLLTQVIPEDLSHSIKEVSVYLLNSFGDSTRIDYGTGHEMNFIAFLYCLNALEVINQNDFTAIVLKVFLTYLKVTRKLQATYFLEPAGSRGVWSLDDYQFLPFYFGSAQFLNNKISTFIKPKSIRNLEIVNAYYKDYIYLECIRFIHKMKTGNFYEHSPILDGIAEVPRWEKVNIGMMKMYKAEVTSKFPVMQHFFFGTIIPYPVSKEDN